MWKLIEIVASFFIFLAVCSLLGFAIWALISFLSWEIADFKWIYVRIIVIASFCLWVSFVCDEYVSPFFKGDT